MKKKTYIKMEADSDYEPSVKFTDHYRSLDAYDQMALLNEWMDELDNEYEEVQKRFKKWCKDLYVKAQKKKTNNKISLI